MDSINWNYTALTILSLIYWPALFYTIWHYLEFYETIQIRETTRVSFGEYHIDERTETHHKNPKKREQEAIAFVVFLVWGIVMVVWWFWKGPL